MGLQNIIGHKTPDSDAVKTPIYKKHHFSLSGWQSFLTYRHLTKYFGQSVGRGRGNWLEKWSVNSSGVIPIRCGRDLLNKNCFTQNEFREFSLMVLKILFIYVFLLYCDIEIKSLNF